MIEDITEQEQIQVVYPENTQEEIQTQEQQVQEQQTESLVIDNYINKNFLSVTGKYSVEMLAQGFAGVTLLVLFLFGMNKAFSLIHIKSKTK